MGATSEKAFATVLRLMAVIAIVAGASTVILGADSILGVEGAPATVDSEMRFYAVWYVGAGILLLWAARNLERAVPLIRGLMLLLFVGGVSRAASWVLVGEPHGFSKLLMALELMLPGVIVAWHARAFRRR